MGGNRRGKRCKCSKIQFVLYTCPNLHIFSLITVKAVVINAP